MSHKYSIQGTGGSFRCRLSLRWLVFILAISWIDGGTIRTMSQTKTGLVRSALIHPREAQTDSLTKLKEEGYGAIILTLDSTDELNTYACQWVQQEGWPLDFWIEVARNPTMANDHPEWMPSIQTHPEWRRFFPQFPELKAHEMVKVYPWIPVLYKESFDAQLDRVHRLLEHLPTPRRLYLNGLQGAPSACGCGHPLCRWTTDYGPLHTATRLGPDAATRFVQSVRTILPESEIIPVWATECEERDRETLCGGVGCYHGACWREWTAQLIPLSQTANNIAILSLETTFQRVDSSHSEGEWIQKALNSFQTMPTRYQQQGVQASRLIPILEGWNDAPGERKHRLIQISETGAKEVIIALTRIEQAWEPRIFTWPEDSKATLPQP